MNVIEQFFYEQAKQIGLRRIAALALADRTTDEAHKSLASTCTLPETCQRTHSLLCGEVRLIRNEEGTNQARAAKTD
jgi:hypothetical protein